MRLQGQDNACGRRDTRILLHQCSYWLTPKTIIGEWEKRFVQVGGKGGKDDSTNAVTRGQLYCRRDFSQSTQYGEPSYVREATR